MSKIDIYEVGPRDGFQNIKKYISKETKMGIIDMLVESGIRKLQITSFMNPKAIPQMADAAEVAAACVALYPELCLSALVPNMHGADKAWESGLRSIFYVTSLSESHNLKNINRTHKRSLQEFIEIRKKYPEFHISLDLATAFGCPFEGKNKTPQDVVEFLVPYIGNGLDEVDLCDTIGIANPRQVRSTISAIWERFPSLLLQVHIHDTRNMGMVNTLAAIEAGVTTVQSTLGGLGGCPFAPGATGNLSTEDLVYMLNTMGYDTGIDFEKIYCAALAERECIGEGNYSGHHINHGKAING